MKTIRHKTLLILILSVISGFLNAGNLNEKWSFGFGVGSSFIKNMGKEYDYGKKFSLDFVLDLTHKINKKSVISFKFEFHPFKTDESSEIIDDLDNSRLLYSYLTYYYKIFENLSLGLSFGRLDQFKYYNNEYDYHISDIFLGSNIKFDVLHLQSGMISLDSYFRYHLIQKYAGVGINLIYNFGI